MALSLQLRGLSCSPRPSPGAGAGTSALAIFTRRDHERAGDLPRGTLPRGEGTAAGTGAPVGLRNGCFPAVVAAAAASEERFGGAACGLIEKED